MARGNTLGVAPTGSGKTIMLSAVVGEILNGSSAKKACVLAHRDEITAQNLDKFRRVNPGMPVSIVDAEEKCWSGQTIFAMVQTLSRERNLVVMPPLDLLVIDEAHHARADSYRRVIDAAKVPGAGPPPPPGFPAVIVTPSLTAGWLRLPAAS